VPTRAGERADSRRRAGRTAAGCAAPSRRPPPAAARPRRSPPASPPCGAARRQPTPVPIFSAQPVTGFRLQDARASYGIGLETFALGFPIHFDWAWRTLLNKSWEDYVFSYQAILDGESSGSKWLRRPKFSIWIGYDF